MKFIFMSASDRYIFTKVLLGIGDASVYRGTFNFSDTTFSYLPSLKTMHVSFEYILGLLYPTTEVKNFVYQVDDAML